MVEITKEDLAAIHDTHDAMIRVETILGNGGKGLCHDVSNHQKRLSRIELIIALFIGAGILGSGITGVLKLLG